MYTIEVNQVPEIIDACPLSINLLLVGDTGVGKTTSVKKYCEEKGVYLKTLVLSQLEASEALGIPVQTEREFNGVKYPCLRTAVPEWVFQLAERKDQNPVLFLDEFLCATPSVMNSFLNFLSEKRVDDIDLSHVKVVAATNVGKYTFEPDNNMLSRFCAFYVVNKTYKKYVGAHLKINSHYEDKEEKVGVLFEERDLKPRCYEQLAQVPEKYLPLFYEGFTNKKLAEFHPNEALNGILTSVVTYDEETPVIKDQLIPTLAAMLVKRFPRIANWDPKVEEIKGVSFDKEALKDRLNVLLKSG